MSRKNYSAQCKPKTYSCFHAREPYTVQAPLKPHFLREEGQTAAWRHEATETEEKDVEHDREGLRCRHSSRESESLFLFESCPPFGLESLASRLVLLLVESILKVRLDASACASEGS